LKLDECGLYSTTNANDAAQIATCIAELPGLSSRELGGRLPTITDGCACCGGDTIAFACSGLFAEVTTVEYDTDRCNGYLKPNLYACRDFCKLRAEVVVYARSFIEIMDTLKQDVVYLDPPWGGLGYKKSTHIVLELGGVHCADIVHLLSERAALNDTKYVILKAPNNLDANDMNADSKNITAIGFLICFIEQKTTNLLFITLTLFNVVFKIMQKQYGRKNHILQRKGYQIHLFIKM